MASTDIHRTFYAELLSSRGRGRDEALFLAFSSVKRERFLGPGPWRCGTARTGRIEIPADQPELLYHSTLLVALAPDREINNGEPIAHAGWLGAARIQAGEAVLHVGAGLGYYTAILASLVGPNGRVDAFEIEADLAAQAAINLADRPYVQVHRRSGADETLPDADVIYVSAGATHPVRAWLNALRKGGRLIFPLTGGRRTGAMLMVTRRPDEAFDAVVISGAAFIHCIGARNEDVAQAVDDLVASRGADWGVKSLRFDGPTDGTHVVGGPGWWLSTAANTDTSTPPLLSKPRGI